MMMMISLDLMIEIKFVDSVILVSGSDEVFIIFEVTYINCFHIYVYIKN
jgi:hypothetical protein